MFVEDVIGVVSGGKTRASRVAWGTAAPAPSAQRAANESNETFSVRMSAARWREWATPAIDAALICAVGLGLGGLARPDVAVGTLAFLAALLVTGALAPRSLRHPSTELSRVGVAWLLAVCLLSLYSVAFGSQQRLGASLVALAVAGVVVVLGRAGTRLAQRLAGRRGMGVEKVVVVGDFERASTVAASIERAAKGSAQVVSLVCPSDGQVVPASVGSAAVVRGGLDATVLTALYTRAGRVVVADGSAATGAGFSELVWQLGQSAAGIRVDLATGLDDVEAGRLRLVPQPGSALVSVALPAAASPWRGAAKRALDLALAVPALLVLSPLLLLIGALIRIDSAGPAFFAQQRVGRDGTLFTMYKFRTMRPDAEARRAELDAHNEAAGPLFKLASDPRITRAGRLLRSTSLDELPQLFNVVRGNMSLVGPRPALPDEVRSYDEQAGKRLRVKPGLTGPWQVGGRSELGWDEGLRLDLGYVNNWSIPGDVALLAKTVNAVITRRGAY